MYLFEELRDRDIAVEQFQVCQVEPSALELRLLAHGSTVRAEEFLRRRIGDSMPGMDVAVRSVPQIERSPSGKMPLIINEVV
jgi:hypothetical protein